MKGLSAEERRNMEEAEKEAAPTVLTAMVIDERSGHRDQPPHIYEAKDTTTGAVSRTRLTTLVDDIIRGAEIDMEGRTPAMSFRMYYGQKAWVEGAGKAKGGHKTLTVSMLKQPDTEEKKTGRIKLLTQEEAENQTATPPLITVRLRALSKTEEEKQATQEQEGKNTPAAQQKEESPTRAAMRSLERDIAGVMNPSTPPPEEEDIDSGMDTTDDVFNASSAAEDPVNTSAISTEAPAQTTAAKASTPKKKADTEADTGEGSPSKKRKEENQEIKERMETLQRQLRELDGLKTKSTAQKCRHTKLTRQLATLTATQ